MITEVEGILGDLKLALNGLQIELSQSRYYHCVERWLFWIDLKDCGLKKLLFIEIETHLLSLLSRNICKDTLYHELSLISYYTDGFAKIVPRF